MDEETSNTIKIFTALSLAVLVPMGSLFFYFCKETLYRYCNKLLRRKFHV